MNEVTRDIIEWDIRNWSISLDYWLNESNLKLSNCKALELGSRNGGLSLWLAQQGCNVICSDVNGPSGKAKEIHTKYQVDHLIEYSNINATTIPYEDDTFDIVVFKSVLGGIGYNDNKYAQVKALQEMHRVLKPGGELFFAENLIGSPLHSYLRKQFVKWGQSWRYVSLAEMEEFLDCFSYRNYLPTGFLAAFGRNERQRQLLGQLDHLCVNRIMPNSWKYILVGVARK